MEESNRSSGKCGGVEMVGGSEMLLRLVLMGLCLSAMVITLKSSQSKSDYGSVSYSDFGAFRYLVQVNGICAGYSLISAIVIVAMPCPSSIRPALIFFVLDQVLPPSSLENIRRLNFLIQPNTGLTFQKPNICCFFQIFTYAVLAAGAVSTAILFVAYKGDKSVTWSEACSTFDSFCRRTTTSAALSLAAAALYGFLSILSSYKVFSRFDPPVPSAPPLAYNGKTNEAPDALHG
ncbi:hypothetical protein SAY86_004766 [Trapa natans]|uniref:CASP-like protein n=1 Tax=Trapa natans TaxID=22666 RepID=A0AAN7RFT9_TRANT|nr:hypothetical protein SAY86_004766 [Trapa natans]